MKTLKDFSLKDKKVLIRCDFNVLIKNNKIDETFKINQAIPTLKYLLEEKSKRIIIITHLGKPKGKIIKHLRIDMIQTYLEEKLKMKIEKIEINQDYNQNIEKSRSRVIILENIRFYQEEIDNNEAFAKKLAKDNDIFINEAFSVCHRKHSSVVSIPLFISSCAGFLLEKEIKIINFFLKQAERPIVSIIGGSKVETKAPLINVLSKISDFVIISGLIKNEAVYRNIFLDNKKKIIAPKRNWLAKDIDINSIKIFKEKIKDAKTVFWNGPFGLIEEKKYRNGTSEIAKAIIESRALSIVGGGETVSFINKSGLNNKFNHISTGGGALLEYIINKTLPGIEALKS